MWLAHSYKPEKAHLYLTWRASFGVQNAHVFLVVTELFVRKRKNKKKEEEERNVAKCRAM